MWTKAAQKQQQKLLDAWAAARFPDPFEYEGKPFDPLSEIAKDFRPQWEKDRAGALAAK